MRSGPVPSVLTIVSVLSHHPVPATAVPVRGLLLNESKNGGSLGKTGVLLELHMEYCSPPLVSFCIMNWGPTVVHQAAIGPAIVVRAAPRSSRSCEKLIVNAGNSRRVGQTAQYTGSNCLFPTLLSLGSY